MSIEEGIYQITKKVDNLRLTLMDESEEGSFVYALSPGIPGAGGQEWKLEKGPNGNYTIKSTKFDDLFLAPDTLVNGSDLRVQSEAFEWRIHQNEEALRPDLCHIVVPDAIEGEELAADISPLLIFPPRTALRRLDVENLEQAWYMVKTDD